MARGSRGCGTRRSGRCLMAEANKVDDLRRLLTDRRTLRAAVEMWRGIAEDQEKEVARLRTALIFYATPDHWGFHRDPDGGWTRKMDDGARARAALAGGVTDG